MRSVCHLTRMLLAAGVLGLASAAHAADLGLERLYRAPAATPAAYSWSGAYIGGHLGGSWGDKRWTEVTPNPGGSIGHDVGGVLGGAQAGFNAQFGSWVVGIEGDVSWLGANGSGPCVGGGTCSSDVKWLSTVTGRAGYAWGATLLYAKGGAAFAKDDYLAQFGPFTASAGDTRSGWTVGGGLEYGFTPNLSAKVEYNYLNLGTDRVTLGTGAAAAVQDIRQDMHAVKVGVNYRFNWGQ
jgi:outer membrane immunogenic protein